MLKRYRKKVSILNTFPRLENRDFFTEANYLNQHFGAVSAHL